jgi:hypothetical protein
MIMKKPSSKNDIIEQLSHIKQGVGATVQAFTDGQFNAGTTESWSASGYLKHLILSVKPVAKAINLPKDKLVDLFGQPERASVTFDELVGMYTRRLADGIRAEDFDRVTPTFYRIPEGVTDEKAYLTETWYESNQRLLDALHQWDEADLDRYQLPHPAVGMVTIREMLFFTVHHNTLHWDDIRQAGARAAV